MAVPLLSPAFASTVTVSAAALMTGKCARRAGKGGRACACQLPLFFPLVSPSARVASCRVVVRCVLVWCLLLRVDNRKAFTHTSTRLGRVLGGCWSVSQSAPVLVPHAARAQTDRDGHGRRTHDAMPCSLKGSVCYSRISAPRHSVAACLSPPLLLELLLCVPVRMSHEQVRGREASAT